MSKNKSPTVALLVALTIPKAKDFVNLERT